MPLICARFVAPQRPSVYLMRDELLGFLADRYPHVRWRLVEGASAQNMFIAARRLGGNQFAVVEVDGSSCSQRDRCERESVWAQWAAKAERELEGGPCATFAR